MKLRGSNCAWMLTIRKFEVKILNGVFDFWSILVLFPPPTQLDGSFLIIILEQQQCLIHEYSRLLRIPHLAVLYLRHQCAVSRQPLCVMQIVRLSVC